MSGANGFVGRHVIHKLLEQKDTSNEQVIICLVRPEKIQYEALYWCAVTEEMQRSDLCIKVMPYDMLDDGKTLSDALESGLQYSSTTSECPICIYHIASVFGPTSDPIQTAKDNVQSTKNAVRALDKFYQQHSYIKPRLVVTSSMAAVRATDQTPLNGNWYTHKDWNTLSQLNKENWGSCYQWSKAESERVAWEMVKECNERYAKEEDDASIMKKRKIEMVALNPSFVFGPPPPLPIKMKDTKSAGSSSYSLTLIKQWLKGESTVQSRLCGDVRDVASAHVAAGTIDITSLSGDDTDRRYILSTEERLSSENIAQALIRGVEQAGGSNSIDISKITCDTNFSGGAIEIGDREVEASDRLNHDLGVVFRPVEETMRDMAKALLQEDSY